MNAFENIPLEALGIDERRTIRRSSLADPLGRLSYDKYASPPKKIK